MATKEDQAEIDIARRSGRAMDVLRVASGNFIEMYDFMIAEAICPLATKPGCRCGSIA